MKNIFIVSFFLISTVLFASETTYNPVLGEKLKKSRESLYGPPLGGILKNSRDEFTVHCLERDSDGICQIVVGVLKVGSPTPLFYDFPVYVGDKLIEEISDSIKDSRINDHKEKRNRSLLIMSEIGFSPAMSSKPALWAVAIVTGIVGMTLDVVKAPFVLAVSGPVTLGMRISRRMKRYTEFLFNPEMVNHVKKIRHKHMISIESGFYNLGSN